MTICLSSLISDVFNEENKLEDRNQAKQKLFLLMQQLFNNRTSVIIGSENRKENIFFNNEVITIELDVLAVLRPSKRCADNCESPCLQHIRIECIDDESFNNGIFGTVHAGLCSIKMTYDSQTQKITANGDFVKSSNKVFKVISTPNDLYMAARELSFFNLAILETYFNCIASFLQMDKPTFLSFDENNVGKAIGIITMPDLGVISLKDYLQPEENDESQLKRNDESQLESNDESQLESNDESQPESSDESQLESSDESQLEDSDESQLESSDESQLESSDESQLEDSDESQLEDSDESQLQHSDESQSEEIVDSQLEEHEKNQLPNSVKKWDNFFIESLRDNFKNFSIAELKDTIQPLLILMIRLLIIQQLIQRLKGLHENKIIHRDLKIENIMLLDFEHFLTKMAKAKNWLRNDWLMTCVIDFGLAQHSEDKNQYTSGTPLTLAPELLDADIDHEYANYSVYKFDSFSLGILILETLGIAEKEIDFVEKTKNGFYAIKRNAFDGLNGLIDQLSEFLETNYKFRATIPILKNLISLLEPSNQKRGSVEMAEDSINKLLSEVQNKLILEAECHKFISKTLFHPSVNVTQNNSLQPAPTSLCGSTQTDLTSTDMASSSSRLVYCSFYQQQNVANANKNAIFKSFAMKDINPANPAQLIKMGH